MDKPCTCLPNKINPHCQVHGIPKSTPILDMFKLSEDERIDYIVKLLTANPGSSMAVLVDDEPQDKKMRRYMAKIRAKLPSVIFGKIIKGPVKGGVFCSATYPKPENG